MSSFYQSCILFAVENSNASISLNIEEHRCMLVQHTSVFLCFPNFEMDSVHIRVEH